MFTTSSPYCLTQSLILFSSFVLRAYSVPIDRFAVGHNESSSEEVRVTTNDWVEDIINAFRGSLEDKIDPLKVPDQSVSFDRRIVGVRFHGDAKISDAKLYGLSGLRRTGDAYLGPSDPLVKDSAILADVRIGFDDLNMTALTKVAFLGLSGNSDLLINVKHVEANVRAHLDPHTGKPVINEVKVLQLDGVKVRLPGLGFFSGFFGLVSRILIAAFKGLVKGFMEDGILRAANFAINKANMRF